MDSRLGFVPHQPGWAGRALREVARLRRAFGAACTDIQHVGATAVPGLEAVPIIDLAAAVTALAAMDTARLRLVAHGYRPAGPVHGLPVLQAYCPLTRQVEVEVTIYLGDDSRFAHAVAWAEHLRAQPDQALAYAAAKRDARRLHTDPDAYRAAKHAWVDRQLQVSGQAA